MLNQYKFLQTGSHLCASTLTSPALAGAVRCTTYEEKTLQR
jgi:hypothetical protein